MNTDDKNLLEGFAFREKDGVELFYNSRLIPDEALPFLIQLPRHLESLSAKSSRSARQGTVWEIPPQSWFSSPIIARQYVHGGLYGKCLGPIRTLFFSRRPMLRELKIIRRLLEKNVPTARPFALRLEKKAGLLFNAFLLTEKISDTRNLLQFCQQLGQGKGEGEVGEKGKLLESIAGLIASLHGAGIWHGDLNLKNLLVKTTAQGSLEELYVIDFKKAKASGNVGEIRGISNLKRLWRSIRKWPASAAVFDSSDYKMLLECYRERRGDNP